MENFTQSFFEKTFPLQGQHLIAASAGTGKTYNMQNVFARLVMLDGLRVTQILVVTFTEAATAELCDRLRRVLVNVRDILALEREQAIAEPMDSGDCCLIKIGNRVSHTLFSLAPIRFRYQSDKVQRLFLRRI